MSETILVVDDDKEIVRLITDTLKYEQFYTASAYSGVEALEKIENHNIDFVILDIMMPGMDGVEVCKEIRSRYNMPILLLSAKDRDIDKIIGLEVGADDYLTKPFNVHELIARVKAHFRKVGRIRKELEQVNGFPLKDTPLVLNENTYEVFLQKEKLQLSTKEFQLLLFLTRHPNQVFSREQIYQNIWGDEYGDLNNVTVHIKNIRRKLGKAHDYIKTVWGVGYKFMIEGDQT
ncbi:response regulator transcription factor [Chengkuizengella axinellae]|uniref:Response regulator transcription factor n=1 Tax=Chengkuizengella axinellae TaxID=3064388 RepID=A0ABT9J352_9BACL|nr:response regulator transcription factor [Chengkuizengella sp. 2205SS18-9]MDP5276023.1 response regulator transcription factor [Chengkuizengella sp. 2205SS18-9]